MELAKSSAETPGSAATPTRQVGALVTGPDKPRTPQYVPSKEVGAGGLMSAVGNAASARLLNSGGPLPAGGPVGGKHEAAQSGTASSETSMAAADKKIQVGFAREEGLNLREGADQKSRSLGRLRFGTRVHVIEDESRHPGWDKVAVQGAIGFVYAPKIHFPPSWLIQRDPAVSLIKVGPTQTFWGLVREQYGIRGNEGTPDQNVNHFINAIRSVNKEEAFEVKTDFLDDIGNAVISGRDASDTLLKANVDLWIPSFAVAAAMDVGSGTVTGEIARLIKKIEQKIADFKAACWAAGKYIPQAIAHHVGETAMGLLTGLVDFAIQAAEILAISTAVGALIGALFGGAGAVPGAEVGFEIGLMILESYGLAQLVEMVLSIAGNLVSQLGHFISLAWKANGDKKILEEAGKALADALGILVSAVLLAAAAYLMHRGAKALAETKFAKTVGEKPLAKWLADRQKLTSTKELLSESKELIPGNARLAPKVGDSLQGLMADSPLTPSQTAVELDVAQKYAAEMSAGRWDWNHPTKKIIIDPNGNIMSGHHRVVAAKLAGIKIPESGIYRSAVFQIAEKVRAWSDVTFK